MTWGVEKIDIKVQELLLSDTIPDKASDYIKNLYSESRKHDNKIYCLIGLYHYCQAILKMECKNKRFMLTQSGMEWFNERDESRYQFTTYDGVAIFENMRLTLYWVWERKDMSADYYAQYQTGFQKYKGGFLSQQDCKFFVDKQVAMNYAAQGKKASGIKKNQDVIV